MSSNKILHCKKIQTLERISSSSARPFCYRSSCAAMFPGRFLLRQKDWELRSPVDQLQFCQLNEATMPTRMISSAPFVHPLTYSEACQQNVDNRRRGL